MNTKSSQVLHDEERTRCEVWTRVMGYHRPVASWNPGKQAEHLERRFFREATAAGTGSDGHDLAPSAQQGRTGGSPAPFGRHIGQHDGAC